jgi:hypothetical protein
MWSFFLPSKFSYGGITEVVGDESFDSELG